MEIEELLDIKFIDDHYDELFQYIGWFGKYSLRVFACVLTLITTGAMLLVSTVFTAATPPHTCNTSETLLPDVSQFCSSNQSGEFQNFTSLLYSTPEDSCFYKRFLLVNETREICSYWSEESQSFQNDSTSSLSVDIESCSRWSYDKALYQTTIVSDFNLVCQDAWYSTFVNFIMMIGVMFGATIMGVCSDRYGRYTSFQIAIFVLVISSVCSTFSMNFWMFAITRFFVGFGVLGSCVSGYVYTLEMVSKQHRVALAQFVQCTFSVGYMLLALLGYLERYWRSLNLIISLLLIPVLAIHLRIGGESPRWLISQKKCNQLKRMICKMAKVNGKSLNSFKVDLEVKQHPILITDAVAETSDSVEPLQSTTKSYTSFQLLRNRALRNMMLVLFFNWFTTTCIYYGLTMNVASLNGDPFINLFLSGLVEIPANLGAIWAVTKFGRRSLISFTNFVCGISLLCMLVIPTDSWVTVPLFLISKFASAAIFSCIYLYTSEMFPTPLRGNALGMCSASSRLGGICAMLVLMSAVNDKTYPNTIFGCMAIASGCLLLVLPETRGCKLPDTIEDSEEIYRKNRLFVC